MKVGDLVRKRTASPHHDFGTGLLVCRLNSNPFIDYGNSPHAEMRWAVLWANPMWTMDNGCSVEYETELEIISEVSER